MATLFLLDMSASTDEPLQPKSAEPAGRPATACGTRGSERRIIDVTKEALVIMAEALEELGDRYAVYGFSGQGRDNVEFYLVKRFQEALDRSRARPHRWHRAEALDAHGAGASPRAGEDGEPDDALQAPLPPLRWLSAGLRLRERSPLATRTASRTRWSPSRNAEAAGITPFCITVDKTGHDYLRQMCETSRYLVIEDVSSLPTELPKIYERWVRA